MFDETKRDEGGKRSYRPDKNAFGREVTEKVDRVMDQMDALLLRTGHDPLPRELYKIGGSGSVTAAAEEKTSEENLNNKCEQSEI